MRFQKGLSPILQAVAEMKWVNNTVEKVPVLWKSGSISTLLLYDKATDCRFLFPSTSPVYAR